MTALTHDEFHAELDDFTDAPFLPPAWADGECDTCGQVTEVRLNDDGLECQDCADARPYDPFDPYERPDLGWE